MVCIRNAALLALSLPLAFATPIDQAHDLQARQFPILSSIFGDITGAAVSLGQLVTSVAGEAVTVVTGAAGDAEGYITSFAGSVYTVATGDAASIGTVVESAAGQAFTVVTSVGGDGITLAESGAGFVTSFGGSIYTAASVDSHSLATEALSYASSISTQSTASTASSASTASTASIASASHSGSSSSAAMGRGWQLEDRHWFGVGAALVGMMVGGLAVL